MRPPLIYGFHVEKLTTHHRLLSTHKLETFSRENLSYVQMIHTEFKPVKPEKNQNLTFKNLWKFWQLLVLYAVLIPPKSVLGYSLRHQSIINLFPHFHAYIEKRFSLNDRPKTYWNSNDAPISHYNVKALSEEFRIQSIYVQKNQQNQENQAVHEFDDITTYGTDLAINLPRTELNETNF